MNTDKLTAYQKLKAELGIHTKLDDGFEPDFMSGGALREKSIRGDYTLAQWRELRKQRERFRAPKSDKRRTS